MTKIMIQYKRKRNERMRELGSEKRKNENEWKTLMNEARKGRIFITSSDDPSNKEQLAYQSRIFAPKILGGIYIREVQCNSRHSNMLPGNVSLDNVNPLSHASIDRYWARRISRHFCKLMLSDEMFPNQMAWTRRMSLKSELTLRKTFNSGMGKNCLESKKSD